MPQERGIVTRAWRADRVSGYDCCPIREQLSQAFGHFLFPPYPHNTSSRIPSHRWTTRLSVIEPYRNPVFLRLSEKTTAVVSGDDRFFLPFQRQTVPREGSSRRFCFASATTVFLSTMIDGHRGQYRRLSCEPPALFRVPVPPISKGKPDGPRSSHVRAVSRAIEVWRRPCSSSRRRRVVRQSRSHISIRVEDSRQSPIHTRCELEAATPRFSRSRFGPPCNPPRGDNRKAIPDNDLYHQAHSRSWPCDRLSIP
jgi:hypothetical protein